MSGVVLFLFSKSLQINLKFGHRLPESKSSTHELKCGLSTFWETKQDQFEKSQPIIQELYLLSSFTKLFHQFFWQACSISPALWWISQPYSARAVRLEQRASVSNHTFDQGSYFISRSKILEDLETKNSLFNDIDDEQESVSFPGQNLKRLKTPNCSLL